MTTATKTPPADAQTRAMCGRRYIPEGTPGVPKAVRDAAANHTAAVARKVELLRAVKSARGAEAEAWIADRGALPGYEPQGPAATARLEQLDADLFAASNAEARAARALDAAVADSREAWQETATHAVDDLLADLDAAMLDLDGLMDRLDAAGAVVAALKRYEDGHGQLDVHFPNPDANTYQREKARAAAHTSRGWSPADIPKLLAMVQQLAEDARCITPEPVRMKD